MNGYTLTSLLLPLAVLVAYFNHRFIRMQTTIAIMTAALLVSLILVGLHHTSYSSYIPLAPIQLMIQNLHFQDLLLQGMLGFLLFAGALTIDYDSLAEQKWEIATLACMTTVASAALVGVATYYFLPLVHIHVPWLYALLFGALISPTDPIAVLATFKTIGAPRSLQTCIAGESLFNDGVGIVLFTVLLELVTEHTNITVSHITALFLQQTLGGLSYGFALGVLTRWLVRPLHDAKMVILVTLSIVSGGYTFALWLGVSGPLAMVVLGIVAGKALRKRPSLFLTVETFWEVIDEILNALLFLLIGCEMVVLPIHQQEWIAMIGSVAIVLLARWVTVAAPLHLLRSKHKVGVLTWGGLRGGLALALALSLPNGNVSSSIILALTYGVVTFSVIIQGSSVKKIV